MPLVTQHTNDFGSQRFVQDFNHNPEVSLITARHGASLDMLTRPFSYFLQIVDKLAFRHKFSFLFCFFRTGGTAARTRHDGFRETFGTAAFFAARRTTVVKLFFVAGNQPQIRLTLDGVVLRTLERLPGSFQFIVFFAWHNPRIAHRFVEPLIYLRYQFVDHFLFLFGLLSRFQQWHSSSMMGPGQIAENQIDSDG